MAAFKPITKARLAKKDNGRVQSQIPTARERLLWMFALLVLTKASPRVANSLRDTGGSAVVKLAMEMMRTLDAANKKLRFLIQACLKEFVPEEDVRSELTGYLREEGLLD